MSKNEEDDIIIEEDGEDDVNDSDDDESVVDDSGDEDDEPNDDNVVLEDDEEEEEDDEEDIEDGGDDIEDGDDDDDDDADADGNANIKAKNNTNVGNDEDDDESDEDASDDDENYLQKINAEMSSDIIANNHHELKTHNAEEVAIMCKVVRNTNGTIIDPLHTTLPFLTRYEIANILGNRATQIESGATPFVEVKDNIIDSYLIALSEFKQKKIPYIIRRPLPNGGSEYWKFADLEQLD
jgi:DNA-directed RNA polymerase subunit K/omega